MEISTFGLTIDSNFINTLATLKAELMNVK